MIREAGYGPKLVREFNELNILRFIKNDGPISRAELAKRYKLSKAAVSEIISNLLELGYIHEIGMGNSTKLGGRKPILLKFNPHSGFAIGIEIKRDHARVALSDLNAKIHNVDYFSFKPGASLKDIVKQVYSYIDDFLKIDWVKKARPIGIGIAIPGLVNYKNGKIQESDSLKKWVGFPLKKSFEDRYQIETVVENDVKAISLGEFHFGAGKSVRDMVYLWVGDGVGAGIIINGELLRGISASAGEVGYYDVGFLVKEKGYCKLLYDEHKNFGDILSENVLLGGAKRGLQGSFAGQLDEKKLSVDYILEEAHNNNPLALELVKEYGFLVGIICINLINTLNPELVVIGGQPIAHDSLLLKIIKDQIKQDILRTPSRIVKVKKAKLKEDAAIIGAVALVLEDLFYNQRLNIYKYREVFRN
ncbi:MAG: ROK family transcriptional regulator [Caldisericaceae bacterium]|nr:ROK family transcriptional regulator [Caldisericaceae bacterium]